MTSKRFFRNLAGMIGVMAIIGLAGLWLGYGVGKILIALFGLAPK